MYIVTILYAFAVAQPPTANIPLKDRRLQPVPARTSLTPVHTVYTEQPAAPPPVVTITLKDRHGQAIPERTGFTHTGAGNIDVAQPSPDTIVVTMTGVAVAGAHPCNNSQAAMTFDLDQDFEVGVDDPKVKHARLTLEGRVIGLLRSHKGAGAATEGPAHAAIECGDAELANIDLPEHSVCGGDNISVNDRQGPIAMSVEPGDFHLHQVFSIGANHCRSIRLCKAASAEFAPDPALDPLWISYWEPFHGSQKKDFGFQVILKAAAEPNGKLVTETAPRSQGTRK
jgi:hypothetical protein